MFISGSHRRRKRFLARWSSGVGGLSSLGKGRERIFKIFWFFPSQLPTFGLIFVWASHTPSLMQYYLNLFFLLHPLAEENLFIIGLWQLKPMHLDSVFALFFLHIPIRLAPSVLQRPTLFYLFYLFLFR